MVNLRQNVSLDSTAPNQDLQDEPSSALRKKKVSFQDDELVLVKVPSQ